MIKVASAVYDSNSLCACIWSYLMLMLILWRLSVDRGSIYYVGLCTRSIDMNCILAHHLHVLDKSIVS